MPKYLWKHQDTGEVVEVTRPISQSDLPPDGSGKWEKLMTTAPIIRGNTWGKKGALK